MNFDSYTKQALKTEVPKDIIFGNRAFVHWAVRTMVNAGELADQIKKQVIYGREIPDEEIVRAIENIKFAAETAKVMLLDKSNRTSALYMQPRLTHAALGSFGESAELLDALQRSDPPEQTNTVEEAGDLLWYLALALDEVAILTGLEPADVAAANLRKLEARAKRNGIGSSENRDLTAERDAIGVRP